MKAGDKARVEYQYGQFFEGKVLWVENYMGDDWAYIKPDDERYIFTFGSARDMGNGYKAYVINTIHAQAHAI